MYDLDCDTDLIENRYSASINDDLKTSISTNGLIIKAAISAEVQANSNEFPGIKCAFKQFNPKCIIFICTQIDGLGDCLNCYQRITDIYDDWLSENY
jgi:hypothetical protein